MRSTAPTSPSSWTRASGSAAPTATAARPTKRYRAHRAFVPLSTFGHVWLCAQVYGYMEQCAPHAAHVRAKFFHVDDGAESWLDYQRIVRILDGAGFNGTLGIVFEGGDVNDATDKEVFTLCRDELRRLTAKL